MTFYDLDFFWMEVNPQPENFPEIHDSQLLTHVRCYLFPKFYNQKQFINLNSFQSVVLYMAIISDSLFLLYRPCILTSKITIYDVL